MLAAYVIKVHNELVKIFKMAVELREENAENKELSDLTKEDNIIRKSYLIFFMLVKVGSELRATGWKSRLSEAGLDIVFSSLIYQEMQRMVVRLFERDSKASLEKRLIELYCMCRLDIEQTEKSELKTLNKCTWTIKKMVSRLQNIHESTVENVQSQMTDPLTGNTNDRSQYVHDNQPAISKRILPMASAIQQPSISQIGFSNYICQDVDSAQHQTLCPPQPTMTTQTIQQHMVYMPALPLYDMVQQQQGHKQKQDQYMEPVDTSTQYVPKMVQQSHVDTQNRYVSNIFQLPQSQTQARVVPYMTQQSMLYANNYGEQQLQNNPEHQISQNIVMSNNKASSQSVVSSQLATKDKAMTNTIDNLKQKNNSGQALNDPIINASVNRVFKRHNMNADHVESPSPKRTLSNTSMTCENSSNHRRGTDIMISLPGDEADGENSLCRSIDSSMVKPPDTYIFTKEPVPAEVNGGVIVGQTGTFIHKNKNTDAVNIQPCTDRDCTSKYISKGTSSLLSLKPSALLPLRPLLSSALSRLKHAAQSHISYSTTEVGPVLNRSSPVVSAEPNQHNCVPTPDTASQHLTKSDKLQTLLSHESTSELATKDPGWEIYPPYIRNEQCSGCPDPSEALIDPLQSALCPPGIEYENIVTICPVDRSEKEERHKEVTFMSEDTIHAGDKDIYIATDYPLSMDSPIKSETCLDIAEDGDNYNSFGQVNKSLSSMEPLNSHNRDTSQCRPWTEHVKPMSDSVVNNQHLDGKDTIQKDNDIPMFQQDIISCTSSGDGQHTKYQTISAVAVRPQPHLLVRTPDTAQSPKQTDIMLVKAFSTVLSPPEKDGLLTRSPGSPSQTHSLVVRTTNVAPCPTETCRFSDDNGPSSTQAISLTARPSDRVQSRIQRPSQMESNVKDEPSPMAHQLMLPFELDLTISSPLQTDYINPAITKLRPQVEIHSQVIPLDLSTCSNNTTNKLTPLPLDLSTSKSTQLETGSILDLRLKTQAVTYDKPSFMTNVESATCSVNVCSVESQVNNDGQRKGNHPEEVCGTSVTFKLSHMETTNAHIISEINRAESPCIVFDIYNNPSSDCIHDQSLADVVGRDASPLKLSDADADVLWNSYPYKFESAYTFRSHDANQPDATDISDISDYLTLRVDDLKSECLSQGSTSDSIITQLDENAGETISIVQSDIKSAVSFRLVDTYSDSSSESSNASVPSTLLFGPSSGDSTNNSASNSPSGSSDIHMLSEESSPPVLSPIDLNQFEISTGSKSPTDHPINLIDISDDTNDSEEENSSKNNKDGPDVSTMASQYTRKGSAISPSGLLLTGDHCAPEHVCMCKCSKRDLYIEISDDE